MTNVVELKGGGLDPAIQSSIVLRGDLSGLNEQQKQAYYLFRCKQSGLDPAAKPFDLLTLNGKQVLYANASATQQLCAIHKLSTQITFRERMDDIYIVSCRVTGADGRVSENQGAVSVGSARGDALANAILKATTKAIRRAVLAHCGLGMLDETEVESIPGASRIDPVVVPQPVAQIEQGIPFKVPGSDQPYSHHQNHEDWVDALLTMVDKISDSKKLSAADKLDKISMIEKCNLDVICEVRDNEPALYQLLSGALGKAKHGANEQAKS